jgi:hypothetical protein
MLADIAIVGDVLRSQGAHIPDSASSTASNLSDIEFYTSNRLSTLATLFRSERAPHSDLLPPQSNPVENCVPIILHVPDTYNVWT